MQERPTMKIIADTLGISIGTVDRALKNRGRINEDTRRKVLEMADQIGYRPTVFYTGGAHQALHVVAIYPAKDEAFFSEISHGMSTALKEVSAQHVTLERMHTMRHSAIHQKELLGKLEADMERWDALIIAAAHPTGLNEKLNAFVEAGKIVVTINSDAVGSKRLFFVGQDQALAGRTAANLMGELLGGQGKVALFTGFRDVWGHEERLRGFMQVAREAYPGIELLGPQEYQDDLFMMQQSLAAVIDAHPDLRGVYGTTSVALTGAAQVLCDKGMSRQIRLIGFDTDDEIAAYLKEGVIDASILQDPFMQGYNSLKLLVRHAMLGWEPPQSRYYTRAEIILKENARGNVRPAFF